MKPKKYEKVKIQPSIELNKIQRGLKIETILLVIVLILIIILSTKYILLGIKYEALNQEKQVLEELTEMQRSMIADLEANCKDLFIEIENLKFGGNE